MKIKVKKKDCHLVIRVKAAFGESIDKTEFDKFASIYLRGFLRPCLTKKNQIEYTYYRDDYIKGNINVLDNQLIFTSIPYDEAWHIEVDGQEIKPVKLLDSLIGIEVDPGEHEISMKYHCDFTKSIIISIGSLIALLCGVIIKKVINKKKEKLNK